METLKIKTLQNQFEVEIFSKYISKERINTDKECFNKMCYEGCINYNKKYSCPPLVPEFNQLAIGKQGIFIILFKCNLNQINSTEYNKVRIANVVMKSRIEKLMRHLEQKFQSIFLSTGSCRLCKPCKLKLNQTCKHPKERRYSLESTGIDCNKLAKDFFNIEFIWYKDKTAPEYTCVVCGLLCDQAEEKEIREELEKYLGK